MHPNLKAFLDMIAYSEIGLGLLLVSDQGYNVIVGSTKNHPDLFTSYADHPRKLVKLSDTLSSTAAGRYQILARFYDFYKKSLHLPDFGPDSQDKIALQLIRECKAVEDIINGNVTAAIAKCQSRWASLPGAGYAGQHMNKLANLEQAFTNAGGKIL
jgi:muramidase (phage lysozyme)